MTIEVTNTVQKHRTAMKITQEMLGEAVGVSRQTIIAIEKGHYTPSVLLALKLAQFFHTNLETIFQIKEHV